MYISKYLTVLVCLYSMLTGSSYKVHPEDSGTKRSSWRFSNLFICGSCNDFESSHNTKVIRVAPSAEKLNKEIIIFDKLIKEEDNLVKKPNIGLASLKILMVDNAPFQRTLFRHVCKYNGVSISNIVSAKSGEEAIEKFLQNSLKGEAFHVIFMDENMGAGISGAETASEILNFDVKRKPVIISTSTYCSDESRAVYEQCGVNDVFSKPFNAGTFMSLLQRHFRFSQKDNI